MEPAGWHTGNLSDRHSQPMWTHELIFRYAQPIHMALVQFALTSMEILIILVKYLTSSRNFQIPGPIA